MTTEPLYVEDDIGKVELYYGEVYYISRLVRKSLSRTFSPKADRLDKQLSRVMRRGETVKLELYEGDIEFIQHLIVQDIKYQRAKLKHVKPRPGQSDIKVREILKHKKDILKKAENLLSYLES